MGNKARLLRDEINAYIGEDRAKILADFSPEDWKTFKSLEIDGTSSYFVRGSEENLKKFEAFFLMNCGYEKPLFTSYILSEYVQKSIDKGDEDLIGEKDLLILYIHNNLMGIGNAEHFLITAALNKIVNRNRLGFVTLVLSERNIGMLQESSELKQITLPGYVNIRMVVSKAKAESKVDTGKNPVETENETSVSQNALNSGYDE